MADFRRARLAIEMILLYGLAPLAAHGLIYEQRLPLLELFPWLLGGLVVLLFIGGDHAWFRTLLRFPPRMEFLKILGLFVLCGGALTLYAAMVFPQYFLSLPKYAPGLWLRVMILYPAISVTAQEIYFRVFYFHRYAPLFGPYRSAAIVLNAGLFAFAHAVLFAQRTPFHWQAILMSFAGGLIFARRFYRTHSFWAVALEHSLYGDLIFTTGLGVFFFTGVSNF
ncbi:MAG: CPBP family intramembrane glutamic endopeptidase [Rhodomicrobium sp.]